MSKNKNKTNILLFFILVLIIIVQTTIIISLTKISDKTDRINEKIEKVKIDLNDKIIEVQSKNDEKMLELIKELQLTEESLAIQIRKLKAETKSDFSGIVEESIKSIVSVSTDTSQGSGFIIDKEGIIVTNLHILTDANYINVLVYDKKRWIPARLVGYDEVMDIALLKIEGEYPFLEFGDSRLTRLGEKVIVIGNPLGFSFSVTEGIVSGINRIGINNLPVYLQIDVPLNPGNSGAPVINKEGKVVGIANFKIYGSESLGFALESNSALESINNILKQQNISTTI
ncbi:MAG: trypsin-like peptidase domain-containing protein [Candidatus Pacearchaeota archaeon]